MGLDLTGKQIGRRKVLKFANYNKKREKLWKVRNEDGSTQVVRESNLLIRRYRQFRPSYYLYELIRKRAEVREGRVSFNLTPADIEIPPACPIRGTMLAMGRDGKKGPDSPTAVRIDLDRGWEPGNVRVISWAAFSNLPWLKNDDRYRMGIDVGPSTPPGPLAPAPSAEDLCIMAEQGWDKTKSPVSIAAVLETVRFAVAGGQQDPPPSCVPTRYRHPRMLSREDARRLLRERANLTEVAEVMGCSRVNLALWVKNLAGVRTRRPKRQS